MPNIKSAEKRVRLAQIREAKNKSARSLMRTNLKKFEAAVSAGNRDEADSAYRVAVKTVDQAVTKGILHKNNAAHKKSKMTTKLSAIGQ